MRHDVSIINSLLIEKNKIETLFKGIREVTNSLIIFTQKGKEKLINQSNCELRIANWYNYCQWLDAKTLPTMLKYCDMRNSSLHLHLDFSSCPSF
jgi:hypothetical protein